MIAILVHGRRARGPFGRDRGRGRGGAVEEEGAETPLVRLVPAPGHAGSGPRDTSSPTVGQDELTALDFSQIRGTQPGHRDRAWRLTQQRPDVIPSFASPSHRVLSSKRMIESMSSKSKKSRKNDTSDD